MKIVIEINEETINNISRCMVDCGSCPSDLELYEIGCGDVDVICVDCWKASFRKAAIENKKENAYENYFRH